MGLLATPRHDPGWPVRSTNRYLDAGPPSRSTFFFRIPRGGSCRLSSIGFDGGKATRRQPIADKTRRATYETQQVWLEIRQTSKDRAHSKNNHDTEKHLRRGIILDPTPPLLILQGRSKSNAILRQSLSLPKPPVVT